MGKLGMMEDTWKETEIPRIEENPGQIKSMNKAKKKKYTKANRNQQKSVKLLGHQNIINEVRDRALGAIIGSSQFVKRGRSLKNGLITNG